MFFKKKIYSYLWDCLYAYGEDMQIHTFYDIQANNLNDLDKEVYQLLESMNYPEPYKRLAAHKMEKILVK